MTTRVVSVMGGLALCVTAHAGPVVSFHDSFPDSFGNGPTLFVGQGAYFDPGNTTWNAFADNGLTSAPALNSAGVATAITVTTTFGFSNGGAFPADQGQPRFLLGNGLVVNGANPVGNFSIENVPAGSYDLYLYGTNFDHNRGTHFAVSSGTADGGVDATLNNTLGSYVQGVNYVVFHNVTPDGNGTITGTWSPNPANGVGNPNLTGEGNLNGFQLVANPGPLGACCIVSSLSCIPAEAAACTAGGGAFQGNGSTCAAVPQCAVGACCNGTTCTQTFQVTCASGGGTFRGAGTVCNDYNQAAGGAFEDIDGSGAATAITTFQDDDSVSIPIGFSYSHYGNAYTNVRVGANGYLSFSGGDGGDSWVPRFGDATEPNDLIAGLWTDLSPQFAPASVKYEVRGSAPSRRLIVQWTNVSQFTFGDPIDSNTFQIVLFEGSNNSEVHFGDFNNDTLPAFGSGLENATASQSETVPTASIVDNGSIVFTPTPPVCACRADFNQSGAISVQDIFDFLAAYFANGPGADFNNSGAISVQDIFDFLAAYFAGC